MSSGGAANCDINEGYKRVGGDCVLQPSKGCTYWCDFSVMDAITWASRGYSCYYGAQAGAAVGTFVPPSWIVGGPVSGGVVGCIGGVAAVEYGSPWLGW
jgi:hypothetical protein